jgi:pimeloyl-ACP methyl ester carboxylesterase
MWRWVKRIGLVVLLLFGAAIAWAWTSEGDAGALKAKYTDQRSRFLDLGGGLEVHVADEGPRQAPVLLLIHGSNASLHTWEPWAERLRDRYRIVRVDLPGHGLTGAHPDADYREETFVGVIDQVARQMRLPRFVIAGNSMGGEFAWKYAVAHPDKVRALVLIDASGAPDAQPKQVPIGFRIVQSPVLKPVVRHLTPRVVIEQSLKDSMSVDQVITPAMVDRYWELLIYPGNRDATLDRSGFPRRDASPAEMAQLTMPTLVMWGAEDRLIPLENGRWYASQIKGARLIAYPGVGHLPMEELPDRSAADLARWLGSVGA